MEYKTTKMIWALFVLKNWKSLNVSKLSVD